MTVASILQETNQAKIAHKRWVKRADHLISGLPVEKEFIPLEPTSCAFGQWFYSQGSKLRTIPLTQEVLGQIEKYHDELHDIYGEIYKIYFMMPQKRSMLHRIITLNSKEVTKKEQAEAQRLYTHLEETSQTLLFLVEKFEEKVKEFSYSDLDFSA